MPDEERPKRTRQSRGKGLRKTTGCITCRRRHVKCDETKPHCQRCIKGNQTCIYADGKPISTARVLPCQKLSSPKPNVEVEAPHPTSTPQWKSTRDQSLQYSQSASDAQARSLSSNTIHRILNGSNSQKDSGNDTSNNMTTAPAQQVMSPEMSTYAPTGFSLGSNDSVVARSVSSQPTFNVAITRWFDMLVGDAALENGLPDLGGVEDWNSFETPRDIDRTETPHIGTFVNTPDASGIVAASPSSSSPQLLERSASVVNQNSILEKMRWQSTDAIDLLPYELFIFQNFVERISHWIDLFDPTQSFSTFVPHLALYNVGLMKAILALSARHISLNPSIAAEQTHDRNDALQYYNETLHYLSKAMQYDTYKTSLELLATALIVSTYEMLDGSGKDWERHLQGVFWIQRSQVIHGDSKGLKQAVWWAWLCQDVWAAFREKRKTFTFWRPTRTFSEMSPYELAARSVYVMAKVVNFCSREESETPDLAARNRAADNLQGMLDEWQGYLTIEFSPLPFRNQIFSDAFQPIWVHPPAFAVALQLHYAARLLLLLNRPSKGGFGSYLEQSRTIAKLVSNICGIAMTLKDRASSVMCSQCLYIAGMCVQDTRQRDTVLQLLEACRQRFGWPIQSLGEELQVFWDKSENPSIG